MIESPPAFTLPVVLSGHLRAVDVSGFIPGGQLVLTLGTVRETPKKKGA